MLNPNKVIQRLIEEVKELRKTIDELKSDIKELKTPVVMQGNIKETKRNNK